MLGPAGKSSKLTLKEVRLRDECKIAWNVYLPSLLIIQLIEGNARQLPVVWRHNTQLGIHEIIISYQKPTFTLHSGVIPVLITSNGTVTHLNCGNREARIFQTCLAVSKQTKQRDCRFLWNHRATEYMEKSSLFTPIYNCLQHFNHVSLLKLWDSKGYERLLLKMKMCLE